MSKIKGATAPPLINPSSSEVTQNFNAPNTQPLVTPEDDSNLQSILAPLYTAENSRQVEALAAYLAKQESILGQQIEEIKESLQSARRYSVNLCVKAANKAERIIKQTSAKVLDNIKRHKLHNVNKATITQVLEGISNFWHNAFEIDCSVCTKRKATPLPARTKGFKTNDIRRYTEQAEKFLVNNPSAERRKEKLNELLEAAVRNGIDVGAANKALKKILEPKQPKESTILPICQNPQLKTVVNHSEATARQVIADFLAVEEEEISQRDIGLLAEAFGDNVKKTTEGEPVISSNNYRNAAKNTLLATANKLQAPIRHNGMEFYIYTGKKYEALHETELAACLQECAHKIGISSDVWDNKTFVENGLKEIAIKTFVNPSTITADGILKIPMDNGVLCLNQRSGEAFLVEHSPEYFFPFALSYGYNPSARCDLFLKFLDEVQPDKAAQAVLQEFCGSAFLYESEIKIEKILVPHGEGANGKSVFIDVIKAVFGSLSNSTSIDLIVDNKDYGRITIANKLINFCSESSTIKDIGALKTLASQEKMRAREIYGRSIEFTPPRLIVNCNVLPSFSEKTHAIDRRLLLIPFEVVIPEEQQDKELTSKLTAEREGILNWILQGFKRIIKQQGQFTECLASRQLLKRHSIDSDSVKYFLSETGYKPSHNRGDHLRLRELYQEYVAFCRETGYGYPVSEGRFRERIERAGFKTARINGARSVYCLKEPLPNEDLPLIPHQKPLPDEHNKDFKEDFNEDIESLKPEDIPF